MVSEQRECQKVCVLEPGLVLIRNYINDEECQEIAKMAFELGENGEDGFYTKREDGSKVLNTGEEGRGRIYDKITRFPASFSDHHKNMISLATEHDTAMPHGECTHMLLNMYTNADGLVWHRDIYENDGIYDHPIANLCVGASCKFGIQHKDDDPIRILTLRSGDCLLFGGPCRLVKHAVLDVMLDDCPLWMKDNPVRFSFTFRDSPNVLGREDEFKYFVVAKDLVGQDTFEEELIDSEGKTNDDFIIEAFVEPSHNITVLNESHVFNEESHDDQPFYDLTHDTSPVGVTEFFHALPHTVAPKAHHDADLPRQLPQL